MMVLKGSGGVSLSKSTDVLKSSFPYPPPPYMTPNFRDPTLSFEIWDMWAQDLTSSLEPIAAETKMLLLIRGWQNSFIPSPKINSPPL